MDKAFPEERRGGMNMVFLALLMILALVTSVEASWNRPVVVVSGTWGEGDQSFGLQHGDSFDEGPASFCVTKDNSIAVADIFNFRVKVYQHGRFVTSITYNGDEPVYFAWPNDTWCLNNTVILRYGDLIEGFDLKGKRLYRYSEKFPVLRVGSNMLIASDNKVFRVYNDKGRLERATSIFPLEAGIGEHDQIRFKDITYKISGYTYSFGNFFRDKSGCINILGGRENKAGDGWHQVICKYGKSGNKVACLELPTSDIVDVEGAPLKVRRSVRDPLVTDDGDVYAIIESDTRFQIWQWKWREVK